MAPEIIQTFYSALKTVIDENRSEMDERMKTLSVTLDLGSPEEFANAIKAETAATKAVVPDMIKANR